MRCHHTIALLALAGAVGCRRTPEGLSIDEARVHVLPAIKRAVAAGRFLEAERACARPIAELAWIQRQDAALAKELGRLCTHDVQLALLAIAVHKVETARRDQPDAHDLPECHDVAYDRAMQTLAQHRSGDDATTAFMERFVVACPRLTE